MGINNDIRPKTSYRYQPKHNTVPVKVDSEEPNEDSDPELDQATDHLSSFDHYEDSSQPGDSFFDESKEGQKHRAEAEQKTHHKAGFPWGKLLLWLLVLAVAGTLLYRNWSLLYHLVFPEQNQAVTDTSLDNYTSTSSSTTDSTASSTATTTTTAPVATTAPAATTDKTFRIEVLNGNGIAGSADKVSDTLTAAGFTVSKVANARSFSYASTYIYYKTGKEASAALIKAALPTRTTIEKLSDSVTGTLYDVVVVVGAK